MSWMGKILGGGIGFVVGGPVGAVLGAVLGHHTMDSGKSLDQDEERHGIFFVTTFSMLGKLSKADGQVSSEEIEVVERVMTDSLRLPLQATPVRYKNIQRWKRFTRDFRGLCPAVLRGLSPPPRSACFVG